VARAAALAGRGEERRAEEVLQAAVGSDPRAAEAWSALGALRLRRGEARGAATALRRALALRPEVPADHLHLGIALRTLGRLDRAIDCYRRASELAPGLVEARLNLANALRAAGRAAEAEGELRRALELDPDDPRPANSLAALLLDRDAPEEAAALLERAAAAAPGDPRIAFNRAVALRRLRRDREAIAELRRGVALAPGWSRPHLELAHLLLRHGAWAEGWREYDWRFDNGGAPAPRSGRPQPVWDGGSPAGRTLLVCAEQGAGDLIQFVRFAPRLAALGARVLLEAPAHLAALLAGCRGIAGTVSPDRPCPEADLQIPALSVPGRLGVAGAEPAGEGGAYLAAPAGPRPDLDSLPGTACGGLRVGVSWTGDPANPLNAHRSCTPADLAPLARLPGVELVSIQHRDAGLGPEELAGCGIRSLGTALGDFASTAAVLARLDLVVTVDTANAHLAGALGRPVWTLLHDDPDWRWGNAGETTGWYPTMRLWRRRRGEGWGELVAQLARRLAEQLDERPA
jgi:tetratricopeptide (TPR) repeat protein